jgi:hypothetical protein
MHLHYTPSKIRRLLLALAVSSIATAAAPMVGSRGIALAACSYTSLGISTIWQGSTQLGYVRMWQDNCTGYLHTETHSLIGTTGLTAGIYAESGYYSGTKACWNTVCNSSDILGFYFAHSVGSVDGVYGYVNWP